MVKIEIYALLGSTVCTVDLHGEPRQAEDGQWSRWQNLAYVQGPAIAHDEQGAVGDLVAHALEVAEPRAAECGGWSVLL